MPTARPSSRCLLRDRERAFSTSRAFVVPVALICCTRFRLFSVSATCVLSEAVRPLVDRERALQHVSLLRVVA